MRRMTRALCLTATLSALAVLPAAAGPWIKAESAHFIVYSDEKESVVRNYVAGMEAYDFAADKLFTEIGDSRLDTTAKLTFVYLAKQEEFQTVKPGMEKGAYNPILSCRYYEPQLFAVSDSNGSELLDQRYNAFDLANMFRTQTVMKERQYFSYDLPRWAYVGLQDYFMMTHIDGNKVLVGLPSPELMYDDGEHPGLDLRHPLAPTAVAKILPLQTIVEHSNSDKASSRLVRYEQWVLTNYFLTDVARETKFLEYLTRVSNGDDNWTAFIQATGMTDADFKAVYSDYAKTGSPYLTYKMSIDYGGKVNVTRLPGTNNNAPLIAASLEVCPTKAYGGTLLSQAQALLAMAPDDEAVLRANIVGQLDFGDPAAAAPLVAKLLAAEPDSDTALYLQGRLFLALANSETGANRSQDMAKARTAFGKAYQINPVSAPILYYFARSQADLPGYPDANTLNAIKLADDYSSDYGGYHAELLVRAGQYDEALAIVGDWPEAMKDGVGKSAMTAIVAGLKAKAPKDEILAQFAIYEKALDDTYASGVSMW